LEQRAATSQPERFEKRLEIHPGYFWRRYSESLSR